MNPLKHEDIQKGKLAAEQVLKENYIFSPPIVIHQLVEDYGLKVFTASFEDKNIAGYIDFNLKRIVVNTDDSLVRQNFSIAHEFGHWIMHKEEVKKRPELRVLYRKPIGNETDPLEVQANSFAAHLLVPDALFKQYKRKNDAELSLLFEVSQSVIGFRRANCHDE